MIKAMHPQSDSSSVFADYNKEKFAVLLLYSAVFLMPLFLFEFSYRYLVVMAISIVFFAVGLFFVKRSYSISVVHMSYMNMVEYAAIALLSMLLLLQFGFAEGVTNRASVRGAVSNFNLENSMTVTFSSNVPLLISAMLALLASVGLSRNSRVLVYVSIASACVMLGLTGTRYLFALSISPVIYSIFVSRGFVKVVIASSAFLVFLAYVAITRSSGSLTAERLLIYDLPSAASLRAVERISPEFTDIVYFFVGNIIVLIPRAIYPDKPIDPTVVEFSISYLGNFAFKTGATYLPGFVGSSWLYGGLMGVVMFSALFGYLFGKIFPRSGDTVWDSCIRSLLFVGLLLQFRNISIVYLLPGMLVWLFKNMSRIGLRRRS